MVITITAFNILSYWLLKFISNRNGHEPRYIIVSWVFRGGFSVKKKTIKSSTTWKRLATKTKRIIIILCFIAIESKICTIKYIRITNMIRMHASRTVTKIDNFNQSNGTIYNMFCGSSIASNRVCSLYYFFFFL